MKQTKSAAPAFKEAGEKNADAPRHVAVIMDGNGRWAERRGESRLTGHRHGLRRAREITRLCQRRGVSHLTLFAFSSENWRRPRAEVQGLFELFAAALGDHLAELKESGVRLRFLGDEARFPAPLQRAMKHAERQTDGAAGLCLDVAAGYGGRWDIAAACKKIAAENPAAADIDEAYVESRLATAGAPPPDLLIRTGGEKRISNFFLWQLAYTEIYFTNILWPDFDEGALDAALADYAARRRRYGGLPDDVSIGAKTKSEAAA